MYKHRITQVILCSYIALPILLYATATVPSYDALTKVIPALFIIPGIMK